LGGGDFGGSCLKSSERSSVAVFGTGPGFVTGGDSGVLADAGSSVSIGSASERRISSLRALIWEGSVWAIPSRHTSMQSGGRKSDPM
jgi:hypothetical protein